ncbi:LLM class F420-dependent oxidoreductase [Ktedonosporobacter rubrisoli]|uniref:LLM class F420-dependent oxidoreductase n=1 Tax=Ktedonosporobacter rubrisoli TaxID=2509675 RepID=UPI0013EED11E|nr:LLM class F420-dependent oxidoreductase [Ktedonosporobacter rubrisoli]
MKYALHGINLQSYTTPQIIGDVARAAEEAGFESLWTGEHTVLPEHSSFQPATTPILDPLLVLTHVAAITHTLKLVTGVIILPQRQPLVLAKEIATLDHLSGGRVMAGFGVGFLEPEFEALGVPFAERGARTDEYLEAMLAIWSQDHPAYHGRFVSFANIQAYPRPLQQPAPPIIIGGTSTAALRRAAKFAQGWFAPVLDTEHLPNIINKLHQFEQEGARPAGLAPLEISTYLSEAPTPGQAEQLAARGVHRLVLALPTPADRDTALRFIEHTSQTLLQ